MTEFTREQTLAALGVEVDIDHDGDLVPLREMLRRLLSELWREEEGFSGKRPFGNSGWQEPVHAALVKVGLVEGQLDVNGYLDSCNYQAADELVQNAISLSFEEIFS